MGEKETHSGLELYLKQLSLVIDANLSIPSLMMSLPLPEALGRLEFKDNGGGKVYRKWWDTHMPALYHDRFNGSQAWELRCDLFHNIGGANKNSSSSPIAFSFPELSPFELSMVGLKVGETTVRVLSARSVARDIHDAAANWLENPPSGYDSERMNRMLSINFDLMEPLPKGLPLMTLRDAIEGNCVELSV